MAITLDVLQPHDSWSVIDSSKLTCFMECPRKYFFNHILGWRSSFPNNHLVFGVAWHIAMEHLMRNKYSEKSLEEAQQLFLYSYRQHLPEQFDADFVPKDPANALRSIQDYHEKYYREDTSQNEVLHTEVGGQVLIGKDMPVTFRLDAIIYNKEREIFLDVDHKTSQRKMSNFKELFSMSAQMLIYLHVMNCVYGAESKLPPEVQIRHSFFYKHPRPTDFEVSSIVKTPEQIEAGLQSLQVWYENIRANLEILFHEDSPDNDLMSAFQQNFTACFNFGQPCTYLNICSAWSNPLQHLESGPPLSMNVEFWDPSKEPVREVIDLVKES